MSGASYDLSQVGLLILLPDLMRQDVWVPLWDRLNLIPLEVVATTVVCLDPEDVVRLYSSNRRRDPANSRVDGLWLAPQMFAVDMSIGIVFRTSLDGTNLTALLEHWKGSSRHAARRKGDLRSVSPIADACSSLIHSPETAEELGKDLSLLFAGGAAWHWLGEAPAKRATSIQDISDLRAYVVPGEEGHPYDIVLRTILRSAALLAQDGHLRASPSAEAAHAAVRAKRGELAFLAPRSIRSAFVDALSELAPILNSIAPPLPVPSSDGPLGRAQLERLVQNRLALQRMASLLTDSAAFGAPLARLTVNTMASNGLWLDDWERHRLLATISLFNDGATG